MSNEKNTLILRFSSMGDVVMTIPVLRCLEKKYPNEKFIFVTRKKFEPFFAEFKNITFFEADFKTRHKGFLGLLRLFKDFWVPKIITCYLRWCKTNLIHK